MSFLDISSTLVHSLEDELQVDVRQGGPEIGANERSATPEVGV